MKLHYEDKHNNEHFVIRREDKSLKGIGIIGENREVVNTIVYNLQQDQTVIIDGLPYVLPTNCLLPLVANQHFIFEKPENIVAWQFNREFYCIADHDAEVGCVGFLFYGIQHPFFIKMTALDVESILLIENLCIEDMETKDKMQGEMLRTLLKRLIINITRLAKQQTANYDVITDQKMDIIRMYNLLLEGNFRTEHGVRFYAKALNRSPKTLANLFAICNYPTPSKLINTRLILEAKRYLNYTSMTGREIGYALGFMNPEHFSRFFKLNTGINISEFRNINTSIPKELP